MTGMYLATQRMERVKKPISHWFHGSCAPKRHWRVNSSLGRFQFITYTFRKTHTRATSSRSEVSPSVARKTLSNGQADWRRLLLIHWRHEDEFRPSQSHQSSWRSRATLLSSKAKHSHVLSTNKISVLCCCGIFCRRAYIVRHIFSPAKIYIGFYGIYCHPSPHTVAADDIRRNSCVYLQWGGVDWGRGDFSIIVFLTTITIKFSSPLFRDRTTT